MYKYIGTKEQLLSLGFEDDNMDGFVYLFPATTFRKGGGSILITPNKDLCYIGYGTVLQGALFDAVFGFLFSMKEHGLIIREEKDNENDLY